MGNKDFDVSRVVGGMLDQRYSERIPQDAQVIVVEDDSPDGDGHVHVVVGTASDLADAGYAGRGTTTRKLQKLMDAQAAEETAAFEAEQEAKKPAKKSTAKRK